MRTLVSAIAVASACLLQPSAAFADAAGDLLARVRASIGADAPLPEGHAVVLEGTSGLLGMDSAVRVTITRDGGVLSSTEGVVPFQRCWNAPDVWRKDLGGEVTRLVFGERDETIVELALVSGDWTTPGTLELSLNPALQSPDTPWLLSYRMSEGRTTGEVRVDRATLRPVSASIVSGGRTRAVILEGELTLNGRWFPRSARVSAGGGEDTSFSFSSITSGPFDARALAFDHTPPRDTEYDASVPAALEVKKAKTGHLLVRPRINAKDSGWWIFDTGAGGGVIDSKEAVRLGLETFGSIPVSGMGGSMMSSMVRPESFTLGPVTYHSVYMTALDLSGIAKAMGEEIAGVVGYNLMHRAIVRLDMHTPRVELLDGATFKGENLPWQTMWVYERHPAVEATVEGVTGPFKLDSGAGAMTVFMHSRAVVDMKLLSRESKDSVSGGVGGMKPIKTGSLAEFAIAGKAYQDLKASFSLAADGPTADPYTLGTLGGGVLRDFDLVLDYRGGRIAFVERLAAPR